MAVGEWDRRELCPDGACVGVIGRDGHCKVCKRAVTNWGNERERGLGANQDQDETQDEDQDEDQDKHQVEDQVDDQTGADEEDEVEDEVDGADGDDEVEDEVEDDGVDGDDEDDELEDDEGDDEDDDGDEDDDDDDGDDEDGDDEDGDGDDDDDGAIDATHPARPAALGAAPDWNERQLCSDGGCIGVIGDDGRCKVCGKAGKRAVKSAPARAAAPITAPITAPIAAAPPKISEPAAENAVPPDDPELLAAADDLAASLLEDRKLCPDGACVGVIGSDGKCKLCGKEAA